jgi:hypothetical protein
MAVQDYPISVLNIVWYKWGSGGYQPWVIPDERSPHFLRRVNLFHCVFLSRALGEQFADFIAPYIKKNIECVVAITQEKPVKRA